MRSGPWTDEWVAKLKRCAEDGMTSGQIARASKSLFGRPLSRSAICGAAVRYGVEWEAQRPHMQKRKRRGGGGREKGRAVIPEKEVKVKPKTLAQIKAEVLATEEPKPVGPLNTLPDSFAACRWIHGTPGDGDWLTCGQPAVDRSPYCGYHHAKSYTVARVSKNVVPLRVRRSAARH